MVGDCMHGVRPFQSRCEKVGENWFYRNIHNQGLDKNRLM